MSEEFDLGVQAGKEAVLDLALEDLREKGKRFYRIMHGWEKQHRDNPAMVAQVNRVAEELHNSAETVNTLLTLLKPHLPTRPLGADQEFVISVFAMLSSWDLYPHFGWPTP